MKNDARKAEGYKLVKDRTTMLFCVNVVHQEVCEASLSGSRNHSCQPSDDICENASNCHTHPSADMLRLADGNITVMYMLPNTTSVIQPLDQGIIASEVALLEGVDQRGDPLR